MWKLTLSVFSIFLGIQSVQAATVCQEFLDKMRFSVTSVSPIYYYENKDLFDDMPEEFIVWEEKKKFSWIRYFTYTEENGLVVNQQAIDIQPKIGYQRVEKNDGSVEHHFFDYRYSKETREMDPRPVYHFATGTILEKNKMLISYEWKKLGESTLKFVEFADVNGQCVPYRSVHDLKYHPTVDFNVEVCSAILETLRSNEAAQSCNCVNTEVSQQLEKIIESSNDPILSAQKEPPPSRSARFLRSAQVFGYNFDFQSENPPLVRSYKVLEQCSTIPQWENINKVLSDYRSLFSN
ncbi:MAG: hypothetical protein R2827_06100 [Bdellovibrionales bacterium]